MKIKYRMVKHYLICNTKTLNFFLTIIFGVCLIALYWNFTKIRQKLSQIDLHVTEKTIANNSQQFQTKSDKLINLKGSIYNLSNLTSLENFEKLNGLEAETLFHKLAITNEVECPSRKRIGNALDGGWEICLYESFSITNPCLVYSFGINNEWSFDDGIVAAFNCTLRAFDPSMTIANTKRNKKIWFYKEGLAGKDVFTETQMWRLNTLKSFITIFKETDTIIDYLKIDIEYYEWESLTTALNDLSLKNVKQLAIEIHTYEIFSKPSSLQHYIDYLKVMQRLRNQGFYKWYSHLNPLSFKLKSSFSNNTIFCCYEQSYININFLK